MKETLRTRDGKVLLKQRPRPAAVQLMIEAIKKQGDYYEDVPLHWTQSEHGREYALLEYIERLESNQKPRPSKKAKKMFKPTGKWTVPPKDGDPPTCTCTARPYPHHHLQVMSGGAGKGFHSGTVIVKAGKTYQITVGIGKGGRGGQ